MFFVPPTPIPVLATDSLGKAWLPALLLEICNGVALVQIGEYQTVRSLAEIRRAVPVTPAASGNRA
jgi:hypothetical protein